jgi:hypothetical protein
MPKPSKITAVRVYHTYYGCDTGCCGHRIAITDEPKESLDEYWPSGSVWSDWEWDHAPDDPAQKIKWAKELVTNYLTKLAPECLKTLDWDSVEIDVAALDECNL